MKREKWWTRDYNTLKGWRGYKIAGRSRKVNCIEKTLRSLEIQRVRRSLVVQELKVLITPISNELSFRFPGLAGHNQKQHNEYTINGDVTNRDKSIISTSKC